MGRAPTRGWRSAAPTGAAGRWRWGEHRPWSRFDRSRARRVQRRGLAGPRSCTRSRHPRAAVRESQETWCTSPRRSSRSTPVPGRRTFRWRCGSCQRDVRTHLQAIYGFARLTDDLGDEGSATPDERLAALDRLDADLDRVFDPAANGAVDPVLERLAATVQRVLTAGGTPPAADRGEPDRPAHRTLRDLGRAAGVLHLLRGSGGAARPRCVRGLDAAARGALRRRLHGAAVDRAPPGRRRGPCARPGVPARRRPRALRLCRCRPRRVDGVTRAAACRRVRVRPRPGAAALRRRTGCRPLRQRPPRGRRVRRRRSGDPRRVGGGRPRRPGLHLAPVAARTVGHLAALLAPGRTRSAA